MSLPLRCLQQEIDLLSEDLFDAISEEEFSGDEALNLLQAFHPHPAVELPTAILRVCRG